MDLIPLEKQIIDLIHQHGMSDIVDELRSALKLSVRIQTIPRPDEHIAIGTSKIGGMPDLPKRVSCVLARVERDALDFIAQIHLDNVERPCIPGGLLPRR